MTEDKSTVVEDLLKEFATKFFYYWWNHKGSNTQEGYEYWITTDEGRSCKKDIIASLTHAPIDSKECVEDDEDAIYDSIYIKVVEIVEKDNIQCEEYKATANKLKEMFDIKYASK